MFTLQPLEPWTPTVEEPECSDPQYPTYADWVQHAADIIEAHPEFFAQPGRFKRAVWIDDLWLWAYGLNDYDGPKNRPTPNSDDWLEKRQAHEYLPKIARQWVRSYGYNPHRLGRVSPRAGAGTGFGSMGLGRILLANSPKLAGHPMNVFLSDFMLKLKDSEAYSYRKNRPHQEPTRRPGMIPQTQALRAYKKGTTVKSFLEMLSNDGNQSLVVRTVETPTNFAGVVLTQDAAVLEINECLADETWVDLNTPPTGEVPDPLERADEPSVSTPSSSETSTEDTPSEPESSESDSPPDAGGETSSDEEELKEGDPGTFVDRGGTVRRIKD